MPDAIRTAQAYLLSGRELTHIDADVSSSRYSGICRGSWYSLMKYLPVRADTRQSISLTLSPGRYTRDCEYSSPDP